MNEQRARWLGHRLAGATSGRLAVTTVLASFALAATGCGDDESAEDTQPLGAFRQEAARICEDVSKKLARTELPHSFPADLDEFDEKSRKVLALIEDPFTRLAALDPPKGHEATFARFSTALKAAVTQARQLRALVEDGNDDTDALWLPRTDVETHQAQAMNEAARLGLEHCDSLDYKEGEH